MPWIQSHLWGPGYGSLVVVISFEAIHGLESNVCHMTLPAKSESIQVQHLAKAVRH